MGQDENNLDEGEIEIVDKNQLRPVSINLLFEGMTIDDDVYDSGGDRLLINAGSTLSAEQLVRIRKLNEHNDTIFVTGSTHEALISKRPDTPIEKRGELERSTGYAAILAKVVTLYNEICAYSRVDRAGFESVARETLQMLKDNEPVNMMATLNAIAHSTDHIQRHILNVGLLSGLFGTWLELPEEQVAKLVLIGLLHDCGHGLMPQALLHSDRKFTKLDFETIKMHPIRTWELLEGFPDDIRITAGSHHERLDGSGYPKKLFGKDLHKPVRIVTIADIYDGMVSWRAYRPSRSPLSALSMMGKMASVQIDAEVTGAIKEKLPPLLKDKPVLMSDGTIGIIRKINPGNVEYPIVEIAGREFQTSGRLYCVSMYNDE